MAILVLRGSATASNYLKDPVGIGEKICARAGKPNNTLIRVVSALEFAAVGKLAKADKRRKGKTNEPTA